MKVIANVCAVRTDGRGLDILDSKSIKVNSFERQRGMDQMGHEEPVSTSHDTRNLDDRANDLII